MIELTLEEELDLRGIAESGQCFRWESLRENTDQPVRYRIPVGEKCLIITNLGKCRLGFDCTQKEMDTIWRNYLDLNTSYKRIRSVIDPKYDKFLFKAADACSGIRILNQDPWETLISFIISQNRNIPAIRRSIELLCEAAGNKFFDNDGREFYSFPTPEAILSMSEDDLASCKLGYRDEYIITAAKAVSDGTIDLGNLRFLEDDEVIESLTRLKGIGPKVANCVALFGLHRLNAFPIDVWMRRVLENEYINGYPEKRYSPYNGVFQQYMFVYYRSIYGK